MVIYTSQGCCLLKKIQNILQQFCSYFKGIIAIESNLLNSKSLEFTNSSKYERTVHGTETIDQRIGEEVLRNYHNTQPISFIINDKKSRSPLL